MLAANEGLIFADLTNKGYATLSLTRQIATAEIVRFASWREPTAPQPTIARLATEAVRGAGVGGWQTA